MNGKVMWNQILVALLIGFALGAAFGQWYVKATHHGHPWKAGGMKQHMLERFDRKLHLSPEQKEQISLIFDAKRPQMMALQKEMRPKFEALRSSAQGEIRKVLNPEQQKKFDEMSAKMEARWKEREKTFNS